MPVAGCAYENDKSSRSSTLSKYYRPLPLLDEWIRRRVSRLAECYLKQWRHCRTRIRNLISLGAAKKQAIMVGISSKRYWRLAKTYGRLSASFLAGENPDLT